jgi:hypothetical protein
MNVLKAIRGEVGMKKLLELAVELLRARVQRNLAMIKGNQDDIRGILKQPYSGKRSEILDSKYDFSKKLLAENNDFINLQITVVNFLQKYKNVIPDIALPEEFTAHIGESTERNGRSIPVEDNILPASTEDVNLELEDISRMIVPDRKQLLEQTISGQLAFEADHPLFKDRQFKSDLLNYYSAIEDYEMCQRIIDIQN